MSGDVRRKWRPPLVLVIGCTLAAVLVMPLLGVTWLRLAGNILGWAETGWLIAWIAIVMTAVVAWLLWRLVLRPVWALTAYAREMKRPAGAARAPQRFGTAELSDLGRSVIDMGQALHARARSLSAYADHVTHELKSPLTALRGASDLLRDETLSAPDREALLQTIDASAARMDRLLDDLRAHAALRMQAAPGETTLAATRPLVDWPAGLEICVTSDGPVPMSAHDLNLVLAQIANNAAQHDATVLDMAVRGRELTLSDDGTGVATGDAARLFDPFFTTRRDAGGTGMGLTIAQTLVEAAGGKISLADSKTGAKFRISF